MTDRLPESREPLPTGWLPESRVPDRDDLDYWERRLQELMAEAAPVLERHRRRSPSGPWWEALAGRWRPAVAAGLAAAAGLVIGLGLAREEPRARGPDPVLAVAVSEGEPAALWSALGVEVDPVLAAIALESGGTPGGDR